MKKKFKAHNLDRDDMLNKAFKQTEEGKPIKSPSSTKTSIEEISKEEYWKRVNDNNVAALIQQINIRQKECENLKKENNELREALQALYDDAEPLRISGLAPEQPLIRPFILSQAKAALNPTTKD